MSATVHQCNPETNETNISQRNIQAQSLKKRLHCINGEETSVFTQQTTSMKKSCVIIPQMAWNKWKTIAHPM